ncbi:MAG: hypothetical protein AAF253_06395 [Pseudomonadota bacterium]
MKHHIMIALGLLLGLIFAYRGAIALATPGWGLPEAYIAGGLVLAGWLIRAGLAEWRAHKSAGE